MPEFHGTVGNEFVRETGKHPIDDLHAAVENDMHVGALRNAFPRFPAVGQSIPLNDGDFFATLDGEANSIAVLIKHMAGNLRSRWTDFLIADGEKADRDRDG